MISKGTYLLFKRTQPEIFNIHRIQYYNKINKNNILKTIYYT